MKELIATHVEILPLIYVKSNCHKKQVSFLPTSIYASITITDYFYTNTIIQHGFVPGFVSKKRVTELAMKK